MKNLTKGVQIKSSTKGVQIKSSTKGVHILTTVTKTTETTTDDGRINSQQTVENTDSSEVEIVTNSGRPCQGEFYHGILGAGLILVSCLLVICSACFNRKCRTKTLEQR
ncbi:uncharacterized protein [Mytilus edulis]|uniref:uncharacterized protein n=1 Tax=Mytilus edulis TaxID=6550 RepID=UPI0039EF8503